MSLAVTVVEVVFKTNWMESLKPITKDRGNSMNQSNLSIVTCYMYI